MLSLHSLNNPSSEPIPLLILLTKSDLVLSSSRRPTTSSSTSSTSDKTLSLSLDRAKLSLAREMERRRLSASTNSTGSNSRGRLEGLEPIPSSSTSQSLFTQIWKSLTGSHNTSTLSTTTTSGGGGKGLPTDEAEILSEGDAFLFEGTFDWNKLGLEINWDWSGGEIGSGGNGGGGSGGEGVWKWCEEVVG